MDSDIAFCFSHSRESPYMPQFRVLITDHPWPDCDIEKEILAEIDAEIVDAPDGSEATLAELAADVDAIATCWAKVTPTVIEAAPRCKIVSRMGIGLDNIAIPTANARDIPVTNVPDYCVIEVAEHALAMMLCCARKIGFYHLRTKKGEYNLSAGPEYWRIRNQTLGLAGFGNTARELYRIAQSLGMKIIAYSQSGNDYGTGCRMVSFDELLEQSDYISIHVPLTDETKHLFSTDAFQKMKDSAYLINTARGAVIDREALWEALKANQIAGAALDVYDPEPPDMDDPLYHDERIIMTPHAAFVSAESLINLRTRVAHQIRQVLQGEKPENVVNPQVYQNPPSDEGT